MERNKVIESLAEMDANVQKLSCLAVSSFDDFRYQSTSYIIALERRCEQLERQIKMLLWGDEELKK